MLNIIDEYTRECSAIRVDRKITANDVIDTLADVFIRRGTPQFIRSDNGPEFVAQLIRQWLQDLGVQTAFIEPGSPWENGYIESFNGKFRDELLNGEIFDTLIEARVITEQWRNHYIQNQTTQCFRVSSSGTRNLFSLSGCQCLILKKY
jgi:transposase InsO family protein